MRIVAEATYPELFAFVGRISELERLLSIGNLTITGPRSARQGNKSNVEMELRVHRYLGDPSASTGGTK
jgi:Tfp pilus assembly protein PilO